MTIAVTHFSMWALVKSPLILGNDITDMVNHLVCDGCTFTDAICLDSQSDETKQIITNNAIIAVNQDSNGSPASRIWKKSVSEGGDIQLWSGSLANKYCLHICYPDQYTNPQNTTLANSSLP